jgi:hypothetical protein
VEQPEERIVVSDHARAQARRRSIDVESLIEVVRFPEQSFVVRPGREIRQSRLEMPAGGTLYLLRVIVDVRPLETTIVTAYRTTRIRKYWSAT